MRFSVTPSGDPLRHRGVSRPEMATVPVVTKRDDGGERPSYLLGEILGVRMAPGFVSERGVWNSIFMDDMETWWDKFGGDGHRYGYDWGQFEEYHEDLMRLGAFDVLIGNGDRHGHNFGVDHENRVVGFDNGYIGLPGDAHCALYVFQSASIPPHIMDETLSLTVQYARTLNRTIWENLGLGRWEDVETIATKGLDYFRA